MRAAIVFAFVVTACGGKTTDDVPADAAANDSAATDSAKSETAVDVSACSQPGTCALAGNGCCWTCGTPTLSDYTAINAARAAEFRAFTCADPAPTCPGCVTMEDPNLRAFCRGGRCTGVDVRTDALSACATCLLYTSRCV